ncbi:hydrolase [Acinetobacter sp. WZC-1]|uniref:hydrolase n=1 Tax=Acinetobacter sp. WZC-1 TaxID=3459034 RepID=UPI00403DFA29
MKQNILLITGWGGGTRLLEPLTQSLQQQGYQVELINIFNAADEQTMQQQVEFARQYDVLIGWSLGGQLATLLVDQLEKQYAEQKILVTLASTPCFVANADWQSAMRPDIFQAFRHSFEQDASATLKKFGYMVCQGVESTAADFVRLQSLIQPQQMHVLQQGLDLLEHLNVVGILKNYRGSQYHLFAEQDVLVSCKVAAEIQKLHAEFSEVALVSGSHGFPVFHAEATSHSISQYLQKLS